MTIQVYYDDWPEYELLDSGHRKKLERFGKYRVIREETKAWWRPELPEQEWEKAIASHHGEDPGKWEFHRAAPQEWRLQFEQLTLEARFTATSKHVGVFPEQTAHWRWIADQIRHAGQREIHVLNLFAYTGIATLIAAAHGASVTHVDSAKGVVAWGKRNQQLSGLDDRPIRWIVDDASKFVQREVRRQRQYDAILMDPPSFGRGPKRELWKIEQHLTDLLADCRQLLSPEPLFVLLTMYSLDQSALLIANLLQDMLRGYGGAIEVGELALKPTSSEKALSMSIFGRWSSG
ncbi:SAM-dependent methyltransferase [Candidatus Vecturithrix granuli]|uniref:SAM-dependent methyltransferase n=1 Tax=Vecturithrix granuli TaxID=1499967 RepID=A0A081C1B5_VECG1|nr:SAM-dependent methyltransferase [Candidatus Vecturithrix granuli]